LLIEKPGAVRYRWGYLGKGDFQMSYDAVVTSAASGEPVGGMLDDGELPEAEHRVQLSRALIASTVGTTIECTISCSTAR
jgi:hypothetical protein